jgi:hypothetical protein
VPRPRLAVLAPLVAALAAALPSAAAAAPTTETASAGAVSASFSYEKVDTFQYEGMTLTITRAGVVAFNAVAVPKSCAVPYCAPGGMVDAKSLKVVDLDGDGEPEVIVDLYTGGAHCCLLAQVYRYDGKTYVPSTRDFADFGYTLADGIFTTGDPRFAYAFASFADSAFPVQLLTFSRGTWKDVTRAHPETLRADAARWKKEYNKRRSGKLSLGILAAYTADQYRLGKKRAADAFLRSELRAGRLKGDKYWPSGKTYISTLQRRLKAWGYVK